MNDTYQTREITSADANTTVQIRAAGDGQSKFGFITVLGDSAHAISFYDGDPSDGGVLIFTKPASQASNTYWVLRRLKKGLYATVAASYSGRCLVGSK